MNKHLKNVLILKQKVPFISDDKKSESYKMVITYYRDKVVFRYGSLPMVKDDEYYEMKL
tara:strand:- start:66 stop:242 length:177 start_codon:yes stop_codon:yes gene_type:complete